MGHSLPITSIATHRQKPRPLQQTILRESTLLWKSRALRYSGAERAEPAFMAKLAPRAPFTAMPPASHPRTAAVAAANVFTSPTESEFSESHQDWRDSVQVWDENGVGDWLRSINCGQYVDSFKKNHINGENLMDMDHVMLKEMGVKRIGDRVRIGAQVKLLRTHIYRRTSKRNINRVGSPAPLM